MFNTKKVDILFDKEGHQICKVYRNAITAKKAKSYLDYMRKEFLKNGLDMACPVCEAKRKLNGISPFSCHNSENCQQKNDPKHGGHPSKIIYYRDEILTAHESRQGAAWDILAELPSKKLLSLRTDIEKLLGHHIDLIQANEYTSHADAFGYHSDHVVTKTNVAILSLGASKVLHFVEKGKSYNGAETNVNSDYGIRTNDGDIIFIPYDTQTRYEHAILPEDGLEPFYRASIAFAQVGDPERTQDGDIAVFTEDGKMYAKDGEEISGILTLYDNLDIIEEDLENETFN